MDTHTIVGTEVFDDNKAYYNNTPHNTMRLFVPKSKINPDKDAFMVLNSFSVWGGADYHSDTHWGWEFYKDSNTAGYLHRLVEKYNTVYGQF